MSVRTANCPSCGGPLRFRGATSVVAVCAYCRSTLVREGARLEDIGKQAELLEDASPLRIGASGRHRGSGFDVVGRIQYRYGAGVWNEWHVLFDGDRKGAWLSDAGGEYTITHLAPPAPVPKFAELRPGDRVTLGGEEYTATNLESAEVVAGEGELPFKFLSGWKAEVADLRGDGNRFATIDYSDEPPHVYLGERLPFAAFGFSGLRDPEQLGGFASGRALAFQCGGCGAPLQRHLATTEVVACGSCGTVTDVTRGVGEIVQRNERNLAAATPSIPLGANGTWKGVKYEVVGLLRRAIEVDGERYEWSEYLLHHVEQGYAWISEYQGHFSFIRNAAEVPKKAGGFALKPRVRYLGRDFTHFQHAEAQVSHLAGEFYWRVKLGDTATMDDYVAPPLILSSEKTGNEITWSLGEYAPGAEVWKAFGLEGKPPPPVGVAPNQPSPYEGTVTPFWKAFLALVAAALVAQLGFWATNRVAQPGPVAFVVPQGQAAQVTSPVFPLGGWFPSPVTLRVASDAKSWLVLDMKLVNADTGQAYGIRRQLGLVQVGGAMENDPNDVAELPGIPPGRYSLAIDARAGPQPLVTGTVQPYREPPGWGNFWLLAGFLLLWPLAAWYRKSAFESRRWAESDYAPEAGDDDGEDEDE